ncbi:MAG: HAD family hydrolase [Ruminococcaceae bacterium]|nr:HAD family hydrolase [Oscillospiraceae bacterium]
MKYRYIIFDLDGTLLDTLDDLTDSVNFALEQFSFPTVDREHVRRSIGNGVDLLIRRSLPVGTDEAVLENCIRVFRTRYAENCEVKTQPYQGIVQLLDHLASCGCRIAVASNKFDAAVVRLCDKYFGSVISVAVGERAGAARKPAPDSVLTALCELDADVCLDLDKTLYIGDSDVDVLTAKNARIDCIAVSWGFRDREVLLNTGATRIADTVTELENMILR